MNSKSTVLIIGDAWDSLDHERDSTIYLCDFAAKHFKIESYWARPESVSYKDSTLYARLDGKISDKRLIADKKNELVKLSSFHSIHWRVDPPVDLATYRLWTLLAALEDQHHSPNGTKQIRFFNDPLALLKWNEKFAPLHFGNWAIPSFASNSITELETFYESMRSSKSESSLKLILKPVGNAASRGVQFLSGPWNQCEKIICELQKEHGPWMLLQEFDENIKAIGETRIFVIGAAVCGALTKHPHPDHLISNLDAPDEFRPQLTFCTPTPTQHSRATQVAHELSSEGIYFATIDFIGDRILEINVTSPGLVSWIDNHIEHNDNKLAHIYWSGISS